jgi:hypothetical protein
MLSRKKKKKLNPIQQKELARLKEELGFNKKKKKKPKDWNKIYTGRLEKIKLRNEVSDIHRITSYTPNDGMVHFFIPGEKPIRIPLRFIIDKAIGKKHENSKG